MSDMTFDETHRVSIDETALALFARLPHGRDYADKLADCLATGCLVAIAESLCIREVQRHVEAESEVVVGRDVAIQHHQPAVAGDRLRLRGHVEKVGRQSVTFFFSAHDEHGVICEARIVLVVACRSRIESRIAQKRRTAPPSDEPLAAAA